MALRSYGVLKGKAIEVRLGAGQSPHYQVRIIDDTTDYRIAVNVKSQLPPSDVEFIDHRALSASDHADCRAAPERLHRARAKARFRSTRLHQRQSLRPREDAAAALQCPWLRQRPQREARSGDAAGGCRRGRPGVRLR